MSNALANPVSRLNDFLVRMKGQMALALPKHLSADRMLRLMLTEFSKNKSLQDCSFDSIAASIMMASQLGLEIGVGGQGYIVPYGKTATFIPGWKGLIDLNARAGRSTAWTGAVFDGDYFDWALGDSPFVKHKSCGESDPAKLIFVYAVGRVNGAEWPIIECWQNDRVVKHRDKYNKVGTKHYSFQNWEMYARKVVLLQVLKYLPQSIELTNAIAVADAVESNQKVTIDGNFVLVSEDEPQNQTEKPKTVDNLPKPETEAKKSDKTLFSEVVFLSTLESLTTMKQITALEQSIPDAIPEDLQKRLEHASLSRQERLGLLK